MAGEGGVHLPRAAAPGLERADEVVEAVGHGVDLRVADEYARVGLARVPALVRRVREGEGAGVVAGLAGGLGFL